MHKSVVIFHFGMNTTLTRHGWCNTDVQGWPLTTEADRWGHNNTAVKNYKTDKNYPACQGPESFNSNVWTKAWEKLLFIDVSFKSDDLWFIFSTLLAICRVIFVCFVILTSVLLWYIYKYVQNLTILILSTFRNNKSKN